MKFNPLIITVSNLLATCVVVGLCPQVHGIPSSASGVADSLCPESVGSGSGLCPSSSLGQAMCDRLRASINFLSFFPCVNDSTFVSMQDCDVFSYAAALLAAEHVNSHPSILKFPELGFNTTLRLVEKGTMVCRHTALVYCSCMALHALYTYDI